MTHTYKERYSRNNSRERNRSRGEATRVLSAGAIKLAEKARIERAKRLSTMLEQLPDLVKAQQHLDNSSSLSRETRRQYKLKFIDFNGILHEMADKDGRITTDDIQRSVRNYAYRTGKVDPIQARNMVGGIISAMRHETSFDGVTCYVDGVTAVRNGTPDEDLRGIDKIVTYKDYDINIDVKSSPAAALHAIERNMEYGNFSSIPMWSGFSGKDFGNHLRVTDPASMERPAADYENVFECAVNEGNETAYYMLRDLYSGLIAAKDENLRSSTQP